MCYLTGIQKDTGLQRILYFMRDDRQQFIQTKCQHPRWHRIQLASFDAILEIIARTLSPVNEWKPPYVTRQGASDEIDDSPGGIQSRV